MAFKAKDAAKAFVVGSSLPATAITFSYLGSAHHRAGHPIEHYEVFPFMVPAIMGSMNAASVYTQRRYRTDPLKTQLAFGALTGLIMSFIGHEGFGFPGKLFNIPDDRQWLVHLAGPVLYASIFGLILRPINREVFHG